MILDPEMLAFRKSGELLRQKGITDRGMEMVLFTMLMYGVSYSEALKMWAEFSEAETGEVGREMDAATRAAGQGCSAREVLNELYRREIAGANKPQ